jgi:hypothetical protein
MFFNGPVFHLKEKSMSGTNTMYRVHGVMDRTHNDDGDRFTVNENERLYLVSIIRKNANYTSNQVLSLNEIL